MLLNFFASRESTKRRTTTSHVCVRSTTHKREVRILFDGLYFVPCQLLLRSKSPLLFLSEMAENHVSVRRNTRRCLLVIVAVVTTFFVAFSASTFDFADSASGSSDRAPRVHERRERKGLLARAMDAVRNDRFSPSIEPTRESTQQILMKRAQLLRAQQRHDQEPYRRRKEMANITACFISLVNHRANGLRKFSRLLRNVRETLPLMSERYPFVAFHESVHDSAYFAQQMLDLETGDSSASRDSPHPARVARAKSNAMLSRVFPAGVIFAALDPSDFGVLPRHVHDESVRRWEYPSSSYWGIPYRHMCRFFGVRMFFHSALQPFRYYMRLDTDSFLLATPKTLRPVVASSDGEEAGTAFEAAEMDLFEEVHARGAHYAFSMLHPQTIPTFLTNLWETYDSFIRAENNEAGARRRGDAGFLEPLSDLTRVAPRGVGLHYWDNVEIFDLQLLRHVDPEAAFRTEMREREEDITEVLHGLEAFNTIEPAADIVAIEKELLTREKDEVTARIAANNARAAKMVSFLNYFDQKGGFYYYRWGDAEVRTLLVSLFIPASEVAYLDSLPYQHYHNYHCPSAAFEVVRSKVDFLLLSNSADHKLSSIEHTQRAVTDLTAVTNTVYQQCVEEAAKDYGSGSKGHGTAAMSPAEASHINAQFRTVAAGAKGWLPV